MGKTDWLDRHLYPFESHYLDVDGGRMHYLDEGEGAPIVMLHGNPTWSFMYRDVIRGLGKQYRCLAPDYLGFGLSDKPREFSYLPRDHAANIQTFIDELGLTDVTFMIHDWGGPIGMWHAVNNPDNVRNFIILNTFMWPLKPVLTLRIFSGFLGGPIGRRLIERRNFFADTIMKSAIHNEAAFPRKVRRHYTAPLATPSDRKGSWVFPRELLGSRKWLGQLWSRREAIADKPALLLWGIHDRALGEPFLQRWQSLLRPQSTLKLDCGHYVAEEKGADIVPAIAEFMAQNT
jgi:haloalkane dehalogenase